MKEIQPEININAECPGFDEDRQWKNIGIGGEDLSLGDLTTAHFSEEISRTNSYSSDTAYFMDPSDQSEEFLELF